MKVKVLSVLLVLVMCLQAVPAGAAESEYTYEDSLKELGWIYDQVPEEVDENDYGYNPEKVWKEFYVAMNGNDANDGSASAPFATLERARNAVREVNDNMQGDIVVHIASGFYYMEDKLELLPEDSGTNGYNVVYLGDKNDMPVISGGKKIDGMKPSVEYPGLYEAKLDYSEKILNLYVNGHSRELAANNRLIRGQKRPAYMETNEWYAEYPLDNRHEYEWFDTETDKKVDGLYISKSDITEFDNLEDVVLVYNSSYQAYHMAIDEMFENPDNKDEYCVRITDYEFYSRPSAAMWPSGDKYFRIKNAFELLDSPGEFYYNRKTQTLYYMPYEDEDMATAEVIMPVQSNLIAIRGYQRDEQAKNIVLEGLEFAHTMWNLWAQRGGFWCTYSDTNMAYGVDGLAANFPSPAVSVGFAENITIKNNYFFGIGGTALWVPTEVKYFYVLGNAFSDVGDTGISVLGNSASVLTHNVDDWDASELYYSETPEGDDKNLPIQILATHYATIEACWDESVPEVTESTNTITSSTMKAMEILVNKDSQQNWNRRGARKTYVSQFREGIEYQKGAWRGDPKAAERGNNNWLRYDFGKKYNVDNITLAFAEGVVEDNEKNNFEILLSNDMSFSEGSYITVAKQTTPAETVSTYKVDTDEKYRYMLIKTITPSPLAISGVWAFSYDEKPYATATQSKFLWIQNNKFSRMGINVENSSAILTQFAQHKCVTHNECDSTGYSAIMLLGGQSVGAASAHRYNYVAYNKMTNTNRSMPDGSSMYTIGVTAPSIFEKNYINNNGTGVFGWYTDGGAAAGTWNNNLVVDAPTSYAFYFRSANGKTSVMGNISRLSYATHKVAINVEDLPDAGYPEYYKWWPYTQNDAHDPIQILRAQPTKEAYTIMEEAGLDDEHKWLRALIPDDDDHMADPYYYMVAAIPESEAAQTRRVTQLSQEAKNVLENAKFGVGLGEIDPSYKDKLQKAVNYIEGTENTDDADKLLDLKKVLSEVYDYLYRYSLEDTLALCKELSAGTTVDDSAKPKLNTVSSAVKKALDDKVAEVEARLKEPYSVSEQYDMLTSLEEAYNAFNNSSRRADIDSAYVSGADRVIVDKEKAEVTVYMPSSADLSGVNKIEFDIPDCAELGREIYDSMDYANGEVVPIYCKEAGEYKNWTVKACFTQADNLKTGDKFTFTNASFDPMRAKASKAGTVLSASPYPYMASGYDGDTNGATVRFKPLTSNDKNEMTFILGAGFTEHYTMRNTNALFNRIEAVFTDGSLNVYSVEKGKKTLITSAKSALNYNAANELTYSFKKINDTNCLTLKLNGTSVLNDALVGNINDYYFGVYSPVMNVEILDR